MKFKNRHACEGVVRQLSPLKKRLKVLFYYFMLYIRYSFFPKVEPEQESSNDAQASISHQEAEQSVDVESGIPSLAEPTY